MDYFKACFADKVIPQIMTNNKVFAKASLPVREIIKDRYA